jgi:5,10-methenyltetrahydrofolate synthetase
MKKAALRQILRTRRRAVGPLQRSIASRLVADHVDRAFHLHPGQRIALYCAFREELDTKPLIELAAARRCEIYFPLVDTRRRTMQFVSASHRIIGARWLDLVFIPLVGFDNHGARLGMGGGYYDRAFAFRHLRSAWRGPQLIGIAYELQRVAIIEAAAHDVSLDAVVTEAGVTRKHIS